MPAAKAIRLSDYSLVGKDTASAIEQGLAEATWYASPVPKDKMRELLRRRDGPALRDTLIWFAVLIASGLWGYQLWQAGSGWAVVPFMIYGVIYGSTSDSRWHESSHGTAFRTDMNPLNRYLYWNMKQTNPPILRHIANLWSLWDYPTARKPWSLERQLVDIKAAGFDGFTTLAAPEHGKLAEKHGLVIVGYFATAKISEFRKLIQQNVDAGAEQINVQLADHDTPVAEAIQLTVKLMQESQKLGAKCAVEVHRDTCTETPEKAYAIAAGYQQATGRLLPMTWDFSHFAVVKHLALPYWERLLVHGKLIQNAQQFHFRPFNGHHCQVPVTDGHGQLSTEFQQWLPFLEKTLALWLQGNQAGREVFVVPEMGPARGGYNLAQLPNSWEDAKILRRIIAKAWQKALTSK